MSLLPFALLPTPSRPWPCGFPFPGLTPRWKMTQLTLVCRTPAPLPAVLGDRSGFQCTGAVTHLGGGGSQEVLTHSRETPSAVASTVGVSRRRKCGWKSSQEGVLRGGRAGAPELGVQERSGRKCRLFPGGNKGLEAGLGDF